MKCTYSFVNDSQSFPQLKVQLGLWDNKSPKLSASGFCYRYRLYMPG